jgi:hypothetical protein
LSSGRDVSGDAGFDLRFGQGHAALDCDRSIAHLAGALGRTDWVVLKQVPDWRWLQDLEDCPWYPTMRLFRQKVRGDWAEVIDRVAQALHSL